MKYFLVAAALRGMSSNAVLRKAYRYIGNQRKTRPIVIAKSRWIWQHVSRNGLGTSDHTIMELGTGWTHANSLYTALLTDVGIEAFDVWDNRSLTCAKKHIGLVAEAIRSDPDVSESGKAKANAKATAALAAADFETLYQILNISYSVDPSGVPQCAEQSLDMIYSVDVLEHVRREDFEALVRVWHKLLKPGGLFVAHVGLDDHIALYDKSRSKKEYVYYSEFIWNHFLTNKVQYFNRLTASEILSMCERNGFAVRDVELERCSVDRSAVHADYKWQSQEDIEATLLRFWAKKQ